jgi:polar amino acid transport system substrate-binding protein
MNEIICGATDGITGVASGIAGFDWELLFIWCLLMAIDITTGYLRACKNHTVDSGVMRKGIYSKMLDTFSILAVLLMQHVVMAIGVNAPVGPVLVGAFCFKELTSILENASGGPGSLPAAIQKWLGIIKKGIQ